MTCSTDSYPNDWTRRLLERVPSMPGNLRLIAGSVTSGATIDHPILQPLDLNGRKDSGIYGAASKLVPSEFSGAVVAVKAV